MNIEHVENNGSRDFHNKRAKMKVFFASGSLAPSYVNAFRCVHTCLEGKGAVLSRQVNKKYISFSTKI